MSYSPSQFICYFYKILTKLLSLEIYQQTMRTQGSDYLYRSAVVPSLSFKKSPEKFTNYDPKAEDYSHMQRSAYTPTRKQWDTTNLSAGRKASQDMRGLRQTFDVRSNVKMNEAISKAASSYKQEGANGYTDFSRSQYNLKASSPNSYDLTSSLALDRNYKKQPSASYNIKNDKNVKVAGEKKVDIDEKLRFYADAVQKFKEQAEVTSKMSEQLRKLKQDRKKRLQAKQKYEQPMSAKINKDYKDKEKQKQSFKKKPSYQYYSPKQQKAINLDKYGISSSNSSALNLDKYKSPYTTIESSTKQQIKKKVSSKYDQLLQSKPIVSSSASSSVLVSSLKSKSETVSLYNGEVKDFVLGKMLGQGKFGTVYQAFHKPTRSLFAIKKIPKDMIKSHLMIDQFCLEIKLQMFLNHQNILTLFNFFDDRTHIYLVLEYMEQGTLFTHLKKNKKLPEPQVAIKIREMASAIKYLHQNQIAHRDIKPENIVMSHGVCKLCDFGWATVCDQRRKTYCGTFDYAPPEILAGAEYDYTVDLWCLGVLTYQLLVGKAPFYHISRKQTMKKILNVQKTVLEYPQGISKEAMSFIDNLIRKDPKQRISSEHLMDHPFIKYAVTKSKVDFKKSM